MAKKKSHLLPTVLEELEDLCDPHEMLFDELGRTTVSDLRREGVAEELAAFGASKEDLLWLGHDGPDAMFSAIEADAAERLATLRSKRSKKKPLTRWETVSTELTAGALRGAYGRLAQSLTDREQREDLDALLMLAYRAGFLSLGSSQAETNSVSALNVRDYRRRKKGGDTTAGNKADADAERLAYYRAQIAAYAKQHPGLFKETLAGKVPLEGPNGEELGTRQVVNIINGMLKDGYDLGLRERQTKKPKIR